MINTLKRFFKGKRGVPDGVTSRSLFKESKDKDSTLINCIQCIHKQNCDFKDVDSYLCNYIKTYDIDLNKKCIILLDDNEGVVSFLKDDLKELSNSGVFNIDEFNIVEFTTEHAGFYLLAFLKTHPNVDIAFGIFDISLGGGVFDKYKGNIVLDGVDCFIETYNNNNAIKFLFFTGNKLNEYIKKNKEIVNKFKKFHKDDIRKYILFKTTLSPESRIEYIGNILKDI